MAELTEEEPADLTPVELSQEEVKPEWLREVLDNKEAIRLMVEETLEWNENFGRQRALLVEGIIAQYDQEGLEDFSSFVLSKLPPTKDKSQIYIDNGFISDLESVIRNRVNIIKSEELLKSHKIIPIHLPDKNSELTAVLGHGGYGYVYRAAYNGRQVAVKVLPSGVELSQWEKLQHLFDVAPPEVQKHLLKVFEIIPGTDQDIIVMEILKPASIDLSKFFRDGLEQMVFVEDYSEALRDPHFVSDILSNSQLVIDQGRKDEYFKVLLSLAGEIHDLNSLPRLFMDKLSPAISDKQVELDTGFSKQIPIIMSKILSFKFPKKHSDYEKFPSSFENNPEIKGLIKALNYLRENGLAWDDMNTENVMMRPSGDLVAIDVGLYDLD